MGSPAYVVKSSRAETLKREVRELVRQIAPEAPVYREYTMEFLARAVHAAALVHDADARRRVRRSR